MSSSRREGKMVANSGRLVPVSVAELGRALAARAPGTDFAFLLGSALSGQVLAGGDVDVAVYFSPRGLATWHEISSIMRVVEDTCPGLECDLGILNRAGVVYRFEALKGKLLFVRDEQLAEYAEFYSLTCREYEDHMAGLRRHYAWAAATG